MRFCIANNAAVWEKHMDGLVQDCSNTIALTMELLQFCTKPSCLHMADRALLAGYPRYASVDLVIIDSDNGYSPVRLKNAKWTSADVLEQTSWKFESKICIID